MNQLLAASIVACVVLQSPSIQNSGHCTAEQQKSFPEGYQDRSDRCEGLYRQKVSGTPLSFTGFSSQMPADVQWDKVPRLDLVWQPPANKAVRLQVLSLQPAVAYRMDSLRPPASGGRFPWPTQILSRIGLSSSEVAIAAWYEGDTADTSRVFLPVRVDGRPSASPLEIILYPGVDLNDCAVSLHLLSNAANVLETRQPAKRKYPAADPIRIPLPADTKPGLYKFEAFAHMSGGGTTSATAILQVP